MKKLHHVCIQTENYQASLDFYTKIMGFSVYKESKNFHKRDYNSWLQLGEFFIELQTPKQDETLNKWSSRNAGIVHMCFAVEDVRAEYERIKKLGYDNFKQKPDGQELYEVEGGYLCKVRAPEGTEIELRNHGEL